MLRAISNVLLGMIVVLGGWPGVTGAATTSISVPVSAVIQAALEFDVTLLPYTGSTDWIEPTLREIRSTLEQEALPAPGPECDYCLYRSASREFEDKA